MVRQVVFLKKNMTKPVDQFKGYNTGPKYLKEIIRKVSFKKFLKGSYKYRKAKELALSDKSHCQVRDNKKGDWSDPRNETRI